MSASKGRKQPESAGFDHHFSQRELKEQQEAVTEKRKTILYWIIGIIVVVLVAALLIGNANVKNQVAATIGTEKYSVAEVSYFYYQTRNQESTMANYGVQYGTSFTSYDPNTPDNEQYYDEENLETYEDYFRTTSLSALQDMTALCDAATAAGYTLSEDGQASIDSTFDSIDSVCIQYGITRKSYFIQSYGKYMTESVFRNMLTKATLASEYEALHADEYSYDSYTDEQIQAYYDENAATLDSYTYRTMFISGSVSSTTDEDGNTIEPTQEETDAAMAAAAEQAEKAVAEISAAEDKEAAFIAAAPKYVSETSASTYEDDPDYSLATTTGTNLSSSTYASWLMDDARQPGDVGSMETSNGEYVVLFIERYVDTTPTIDVRDIFIAAEYPEDDETTEDVDESLTATQESIDAAKAKCEELLATWESGDKTADAFGLLAEENSDDTTTVEDGGKRIYMTEDTLSSLATFNDWAFSDERQPGDTTIIEDTSSSAAGWHLFYFDKHQGPYWQYTAITALRTTDQEDWLTALKEPYEIKQEKGISLL
ncbi:MAG: peptidyl-prolyl cis-trans isomerase [Oscillospiraceae bacterium]|nr:peptidyl-prolyl cis-trans isomerase [Oscillospiraceae bacterium]